MGVIFSIVVAVFTGQHQQFTDQSVLITLQVIKGNAILILSLTINLVL